MIAGTVSGASVTGTINFATNTTNYFDPGNGLVPSDCLNTIGTTVIVSPTAIEFGAADGANRDTADFTSVNLLVTDVMTDTAAPWTMTFTSPDFAGLSLVEISDNYPNGGVDPSLVGDTITLHWAGSGDSLPGTFSANYQFQAVPEASTAAALALGFGLFSFRRTRPRNRG